ncbi:metallophosphatase domain-containing protein [Christiangramia aquimixticola]|uniref:metallophosphatase domain-containing protein n=1 Tax=Christiangramia aquimixticola TaxID=1697558 RepID=UPI003AA808F3
MRLVCLADTHNQHHDIALPDGDVLIHAGDFTDGGTRNETNNFLNWIAAQPHKYKLIVPGNHDFFFEKQDQIDTIPGSVTLLIDSGININGINFWGTPMTPGLENWAFNKERGKAIGQHWKKIPLKTDVLITHTPPYGIMDQIGSGLKLGCEELAKSIDLVQPKLHLFGHIHHSSGSLIRENTEFYNLSILDEQQRIMHSPTIIDL